MQILKTVLQEKTVDEFFSKFFGRLPLVVPGSAKPFEDHLNWSVLAEILSEKKSILRIVKNGEMVKDYAECEIQHAKKYHQTGHTLVIKNAEKSHPLLKNLAQEFSSFFYAPVDIQLFCSPTDTSGFTWHYDVEDVFVFQTQGSKHFTLRQNTLHPSPSMASLPKDLGFEKEQSDLFINVTLAAGDWLYIPAGWWHKAHTTDQESMHISLGVLSRSAIDILPLLTKELAENFSWRTRLPLHQSFSSSEQEVAFYQEGMTKLSHHLVSKMSDPQFIKYLLSSLREVH